MLSQILFQGLFVERNSCKLRNDLMFILAARSLQHAFETLTTEERSTRERVYSIPGLSLNTNTKNSKEIVQILLKSELKDKNIVV